MLPLETISNIRIKTSGGTYRFQRSLSVLVVRTFSTAAIITILVVGLVLALAGVVPVGPGESGKPLICRTIQVSTPRTLYSSGETVIIHVKYVHLVPGCFEALILHTHTIAVDANGALLERWNTTGDSVRDVRWVPNSNSIGTSIAIRACEEAGQGFALCSSTDITVTSRSLTYFLPVSTALEIATTVLVSLVVGIGIGLLSGRPRER